MLNVNQALTWLRLLQNKPSTFHKLNELVVSQTEIVVFPEIITNCSRLLAPPTNMNYRTATRSGNQQLQQNVNNAPSSKWGRHQNSIGIPSTKSVYKNLANPHSPQNFNAQMQPGIAATNHLQMQPGIVTTNVPTNHPQMQPGIVSTNIPTIQTIPGTSICTLNYFDFFLNIFKLNSIEFSIINLRIESTNSKILKRV